MDTRNFTFMFYGFAAAWIILVVYILMMASRERKLKQQLNSLRSMIDYKEPR